MHLNNYHSCQLSIPCLFSFFLTANIICVTETSSQAFVATLSLLNCLLLCLYNVCLSMSGEWADEDFSIACMYAVDYRVVGGYNLSADNFQFDLYQRHVASGLQVVKLANEIPLLI